MPRIINYRCDYCHEQSTITIFNENTNNNYNFTCPICNFINYFYTDSTEQIRINDNYVIFKPIEKFEKEKNDVQNLIFKFQEIIDEEKENIKDWSYNIICKKMMKLFEK